MVVFSPNPARDVFDVDASDRTRTASDALGRVLAGDGGVTQIQVDTQSVPIQVGKQREDFVGALDEQFRFELDAHVDTVGVGVVEDRCQRRLQVLVGTLGRIAREGAAGRDTDSRCVDGGCEVDCPFRVRDAPRPGVVVSSTQTRLEKGRRGCIVVVAHGRVGVDVRDGQVGVLQGRQQIGEILVGPVGEVRVWLVTQESDAGVAVGGDAVDGVIERVLGVGVRRKGQIDHSDGSTDSAKSADTSRSRDIEHARERDRRCEERERSQPPTRSRHRRQGCVQDDQCEHARADGRPDD